MKTIYISNIENKDYIDYISIQILSKGWNICIPYKNYEFAHNYLSFKNYYYMKLALTFLSICDCIIMLKKWRKFYFSKEEHKYAKEHNIPIFYESKGIPEPNQLMLLMETNK